MLCFKNDSPKNGSEIIIIALVFGFLITAFLYASVGFGGGSTYNALLIIAETDYQLVPKIALCCNLIVVSGGVLRYHKNKMIPWNLTLPLVAVSVPFAWLGGYTSISQFWFSIALGSSLFLAGFTMLLRPSEVLKTAEWTTTKSGYFCLSIVSGGLGFLAGLVGIGGGIFFSPLLHLLKTIPSKNIAAFSSFFILVNSISGLIGQFMKYDDLQQVDQFFEYSWLFIMVLIGGQIGSHFGIKVFRPEIVRRLTAVLVLYVGVRLILLAITA